MKVGDVFTVAGLVELYPNPRRKWWTPWRPRLIPGDQLRKFTVTKLG